MLSLLTRQPRKTSGLHMGTMLMGRRHYSVSAQTKHRTKKRYVDEQENKGVVKATMKLNTDTRTGQATCNSGVLNFTYLNQDKGQNPRHVVFHLTTFLPANLSTILPNNSPQQCRPQS